VLDFNVGFECFEFEDYNERLLNKRTSLEDNIFQLLKMKKEIEAFEFDYVLEKYFHQLEFSFFVVNWLEVNLSFYNKDRIDINIIGAFSIQNGYFEKHYETVLKHFYDPKKITLKESFTVLELVKNYIPDLISRYGPINSEEKLIEETIDEENNISKISSSKKIKKKPLVTDEDAEEFLLETVFNIVKQ